MGGRGGWEKISKTERTRPPGSSRRARDPASLLLGALDLVPLSAAHHDRRECCETDKVVSLVVRLGPSPTARRRDARVPTLRSDELLA